MYHKRLHPKRRRTVLIGLASIGLLSSVTAMVALAQGSSQNTAAAQGIVCPSPNAAIGAVPAAAQAEVTRELANLDKQIADANQRLATSAGQGGVNFVQNAILGPLADKRTAALNRIETAIGRVAAKPQGLEQFAQCEVAAADPAATTTTTTTSMGGDTTTTTSAPDMTTTTSGHAMTTTTSAPAMSGSQDPSAGMGADAAAQSIACPSPHAAIGTVPAAAQAEVTRELANLDKQIADANQRLATSAGQGGVNFVQNAILGPLADKRTAALNRIATAIGRVAAKPQGLAQFAKCEVGAVNAAATTTTSAAAAGMGADAAQSIACPSPNAAIGAVPAAAQAEVTRELANLDKQIAEANQRLATSAGQGGANFVQNAILGPLADKRAAALNRISIAIGRVTAKPVAIDKFAKCEVQQ
jgi:uncharacterized protein YceH (UPF0502 family)